MYYYVIDLFKLLVTPNFFDFFVNSTKHYYFEVVMILLKTHFSLILLKISKTVEDSPSSITIPNIIFDDVINEGILFSRILLEPNMNPHIIVKTDKLVLFPISLLVDNIADASVNSFSSTCVNTKRLFGDENNPCPIPWRIHANNKI